MAVCQQGWPTEDLRAGWHKPVILALEKLRQMNYYEFEVSLGSRLSAGLVKTAGWYLKQTMKITIISYLPPGAGEVGGKLVLCLLCMAACRSQTQPQGSYHQHSDLKVTLCARAAQSSARQTGKVVGGRRVEGSVATPQRQRLWALCLPAGEN